MWLCICVWQIANGIPQSNRKLWKILVPYTVNFPVTWKNRSRYLQRVFSDALRAKTDKLRFCLVYTSINNIILRAGTSICASSGFGPLGPKPCGGNEQYHITCGDFNICLLGFWPSGAKTLRGQSPHNGSYRNREWVTIIVLVESEIKHKILHNNIEKRWSI